MSRTFVPRARIGNYEMLVELASGGMAAVAIARQHGAAGFERLVVLKRVHRHLLQNRDFTNMFRDEARLASSVRHANVVPVVDVVEDGDELTLVMEYFESQPLSALVEATNTAGARLPVPVVMRILGETLAGLHAAHEAVDLRRNKLGIVHRDVSPQNIIVDVEGASRVIDFGIAKAASRLTQTRSGHVKGKSGYMAPEQLEALPVDRRADVFAAGVILFELLTGQRLFGGEDEFETMRKVLSGVVPDVSTLGADAVFEAIVHRALARDPDQRFQTALAFQEALARAVPPAPAHDVAACLLEFCASAFEERHRKLQAALGDELEKLSPRSGGRTTVRGMPPGPASPPSPPFASLEAETSTHVSSLRGMTATHGLPRPWSPTRWVGALLVAIAFGAVATAFTLRGSGTHEANALPTTSPRVPLLPTLTSTPATPTASAILPPTSGASPSASLPLPLPSPASLTSIRRAPRSAPSARPSAADPKSERLQDNPYGTGN